jgi:hypothetical protein
MSVRLKAIELAELLGVAQATVSGAAINDHLCSGYPVAEWAEKNVRGRILGYDVPDEVYQELTGQKVKKRSDVKRTNSSKEELRDKLFDKWYEAIHGLSLEEIEEKERIVEEKFSGVPLEEFKRAKAFEIGMREVEKMLSEAE